MIFDSEWLTEYLDGAPDLDTLAKRLTDCGCLVELREKGDGAEKWDVEVTTNRPDAMNHRGLAREAAVAVGGQLRPLDFELSECEEDATELATVEIADPALCSRYVARVIRGVSVGPSPEWMQRRLLNCGVRPINAVVDATNYVLLELGQPLHAFDLDLVRGRRIVVRSAEAGEKLTTLDGEERGLDPSMLMIADGEGVVALAGIMGGADSEINDDTTDVLLESAHFDALSVRRTARRLGMHTEASHRFERGTDPEMAAAACDRAAALIAELGGGRVCRGRIDVYPRRWEPQQMEFSVAELSAFAGLEIPSERVIEILDALEFFPEMEGDQVQVNVPPHKLGAHRPGTRCCGRGGAERGHDVELYRPGNRRAGRLARSLSRGAPRAGQPSCHDPGCDAPFVAAGAVERSPGQPQSGRAHARLLRAGTCLRSR
jgi:phenylalanyl-tRNA synthetase beta subunit